MHRCIILGLLTTSALGASVLGFEPFELADETEEFQIWVTAAANRRGEVWYQWTQAAFDEYPGSRGTRQDQAGGLIGDRVFVEAPSGSSQHANELVVGGDGSVVVAWTGVESGSVGAFVSSFDPDGKASSPPWTVSFEGLLVPSSALVRPLPELGGWIAAYSGFVVDQPRDVYLQRLSAAGDRIGGAIPVSLPAPGDEHGAYSEGLAVSEEGRVLITWAGSGESGDGSGAGVFGRVYDGLGAALTPAFSLSQTLLDDQVGSQAVADPWGGFFVVWTSYGPTGYDIYGRAFSRYGQPTTDEFRINAFSDGFQYNASLSTDGIGNYLVAWPTTRYESPIGEFWGSETVARLLSASGTFLSGDLFLLGHDFLPDEYPGASLSASGVGAIGWQQGNGTEYDAWGRRLTLPCVDDEISLCLAGGRYLVRADWETAEGARGFGQAFSFSDEAGGFTFFDEENLELIVKVLDGCELNDKKWIYAAGLTDVAVTLTVLDRWTGTIWSYENPPKVPFPPVQNVEALGGCNASEPPPLPETWGAPGPWIAAATSISPANRADAGDGRVAPLSSPRAFPRDAASAGGCVASETSICLQSGRFRVTATYATPHFGEGSAHAGSLSDQSGTFWFFDAKNLELFVKVLDACDAFGSFWVFASGLTDVEVVLSVEDLATGSTKVYSSALDTPFQPIQDVQAFACSVVP